MATAGTIPETGVIRAGELYTLTELKRRMGLGDSGWRELRDRGLQSVLIGKKTCVLGADVLRLVREMSRERTCRTASKSSKLPAATA
jgi:hypothetical protein